MESSSFIFDNFKTEKFKLTFEGWKTGQYVNCLVSPECLSVKICCISPSDSEANRDGADTESSFPLFFSFSGSFKNSRTREKKISGEEENICRRRKYLAKRFAHAIRVHYRDFELAYVCWIWLRVSGVIIIRLKTITKLFAMLYLFYFFPKTYNPVQFCPAYFLSRINHDAGNLFWGTNASFLW